MDSKLKGAFTLSEKEWIILAYGLGVTSIFGFPKTNTPPDRESVIKAVSDLTNKKYIEPEGGSFKVLSPYRDAVLRTGIGNALFVRSRSDRLPDFICYCGEPILLCEPMAQKNDVYRFEFADIENLWDRLSSAGYFPENELVLGEEIDLDSVVDMEEAFLSDVFNNKELDAFSSVVFWIGHIGEGDKNNEFLAIIEHPLFRYTLTDKNGERTRQLFDETQMKEMVFDFLKEANA